MTIHHPYPFPNNAVFWSLKNRNCMCVFKRFLTLEGGWRGGVGDRESLYGGGGVEEWTLSCMCLKPCLEKCCVEKSLGIFFHIRRACVISVDSEQLEKSQWNMYIHLNYFLALMGHESIVLTHESIAHEASYQLIDHLGTSNNSCSLQGNIRGIEYILPCHYMVV